MPQGPPGRDVDRFGFDGWSGLAIALSDTGWKVLGQTVTDGSARRHGAARRSSKSPSESLLGRVRDAEAWQRERRDAREAGCLTDTLSDLHGDERARLGHGTERNGHGMAWRGTARAQHGSVRHWHGPRHGHEHGTARHRAARQRQRHGMDAARHDVAWHRDGMGIIGARHGTARHVWVVVARVWHGNGTRWHCTARQCGTAWHGTARKGIARGRRAVTDAPSDPHCKAWRSTGMAPGTGLPSAT